jgi:hypothetical protein
MIPTANFSPVDFTQVRYLVLQRIKIEVFIAETG